MAVDWVWPIRVLLSVRAHDSPVARIASDHLSLGWFTNAGLVVAAIVMFGASVLLFYGLATGQGGG